MNTKTTAEGVVWRIVPSSAAISLFANGTIEIYALHENGESLVTNLTDMDECILAEIPLGIEVGKIQDMLPCCPKCGGRLVPSRNDRYDWECLECDEDFISSEITDTITDYE